MDKFLTIDEDPIDGLKEIDMSMNTQHTTPEEEKSTFEINNRDINTADLFNEYLRQYEKPIKLIILTPCYGGNATVNYMVCLMNTINFFRGFNITIEAQFCKNDSLVTRARNNLIAKGMTHEDSTHFLFIDADISWNPNEIIKLFIADKDIIGGVYPLKAYKWEKLLDMNDDKRPVDMINTKKGTNEFFNMFDNEAILKAQLLRYNMNPLDTKIVIENNVAEVRHIPTGFMLIKREAIERMFEEYKDTKYIDDIGYLNSQEEKNAYALFDCGVIDKHYLSEDWLFCERWRKIGGQIFMDVTVMLSHTGPEDFTGSFILST